MELGFLKLIAEAGTIAEKMGVVPKQGQASVIKTFFFPFV